jgi:hypothetical protein
MWRIADDTGDFAEWKTDNGGQDTHSITDDPLFVTNGSDYRLQNGSPCIDTGVVVANVGQSVIGAGPDMGAYEKPLALTDYPFSPFPMFRRP